MAIKLILITGLLFSLLSCSENSSNKETAAQFDKENTAAILITECHDFKKLETCQKALKLAEEGYDPDSMPFAHVLNSLAYAYMQENNFAKSESLYIRSIKIAKKALDPKEINIIILFRINNDLGALYRVMGKYDKAIELLKRSLKRAEAILPPDDPFLIEFLIELSRGYFKTGNYPEAEKLAKRALKISDEKLASFRRREALNNLALLYLDQKRFDEARPLLKRSLEKTEQDLGLYYLYVAQAHLDMAKKLYSLGIIIEVEAFLESSLNIYQEKLSVSDLANKAMVLVDFKELYEKIGNDKEAARVEDLMKVARLNARIEAKIRLEESHYIKADGDCKDLLKLTKEEANSNYFFVAEVLLRIGSEYTEQGKYEKAGPYFKCSLEAMEKSPDLPPSYIPLALNRLSSIYSLQKRYEEVEPLLKRALEMAETDLESDDTVITTILYSLARLYKSQNKIDKAVPLLERSIKLLENNLGPYDQRLADPLALMGEVHMLQDKDSEALQYMERAEAILDMPFTSESLKILAFYENLEKLYNKIGKPEEAGRVRRSINRIRNLRGMEEKEE